MKKKVKSFSVGDLSIEKNVPLTPRSQDTSEMFNLLVQMNVGDSVKMPKAIHRTFVNAKTTLKRLHGRVIVYRNLDKYNFRCWRVEDNTTLRTKRKK